jgi:SH3-like domain-containing protein
VRADTRLISAGCDVGLVLSEGTLKTKHRAISKPISVCLFLSMIPAHSARRKACLKERWANARRRTAIGGLALVIALAATAADAAGDLPMGAASGLPVPRFVSLKPDRVTVRGGPNRDHDISFVFTRSGLPVEITAESDNWRRIRDWEGSEGWVYHSLLSGRRTALVAAKQPDELVPLYDRADAQGVLVARLQPGVLATVKHCSGTWCRILGSGFDGWIAQERLWGVYANEKID